MMLGGLSKKTEMEHNSVSSFRIADVRTYPHRK